MTVAVGIIWQWLFNEKVGLINYALISLGLIEDGIPFLESFDYALPAVIIASIWQVVGFYMIILLTGLQSIPPNLYEAASIDGASPWQQFRRITLPLLRPSLFLCFVIGIINSFTAFDLIFVMTGGGPGRSTDLLITYIYSSAFRLSKFDYAAAMTVVKLPALPRARADRQLVGRRRCGRRQDGKLIMRRNRASTIPVHIALMVVSTIMLVPFYWVLKTSLTGENIFAFPPALLPEDPQAFFYVDVWYAIPFVRYLFNSVVVSLMVVIANVVLNATAGYALTREFPGKRLTVLLFLSCMMIPFQVTIIPAYLITAELGILNSYLGMALPLMSTIVCIFIFKAAFEAIPKSLIDAARIDGVPRLDDRLPHHHAADQARHRHQRHPLLHLVVEQLPVAAGHRTRRRDADLTARPVALPERGRGHDRGALRLLRDGAGAGPCDLPSGAEGVHPRPHLRRDEGVNAWSATGS